MEVELESKINFEMESVSKSISVSPVTPDSLKMILKE